MGGEPICINYQFSTSLLDQEVKQRPFSSFSKCRIFMHNLSTQVSTSYNNLDIRPIYVRVDWQNWILYRTYVCVDNNNCILCRTYLCICADKLSLNHATIWSVKIFCIDPIEWLHFSLVLGTKVITMEHKFQTTV